jgi:hypothetical protein
MPRRGYRTQSRVSTLGTHENERFALKGAQVNPGIPGTSYLATISLSLRDRIDSVFSCPYKAVTFFGITQAEAHKH